MKYKINEREKNELRDSIRVLFSYFGHSARVILRMFERVYQRFVCVCLNRTPKTDTMLSKVEVLTNSATEPQFVYGHKARRVVAFLTNGEYSDKFALECEKPHYTPEETTTYDVEYLNMQTFEEGTQCTVR